MALVTEVPAVKESLKGTDGLTWTTRMKLQLESHQDEKAAAYLTVDEKMASWKPLCGRPSHGRFETPLSLQKLSQVQQGINMARANLSKEQPTALSQQVSLKEKIDEKKLRLKMVAKPWLQVVWECYFI